MRYKPYIIIFLFIVSLASVGGAYYWHHSHHGRSNESRITIHESRHLYHCPMHPNYISDKPGECPICGMDLVPVEEEEHEAGDAKREGDSKSSDRASITVSLDRQQLIGVKTKTIKKGEAILMIRAVATAAFNPDMAVAQREYLEAKKMHDASLTEAAKERLIVLGMNEEEIKGLKNVQKGLYLQSKNSWVYPIIYEYELPYVKIGQEVIITFTNGKELGGIVRSIDSIIDHATRSARLHVEMKNEKGEISPSAFGTANIKIDLGEKLLVPKSAVITTGERNVIFMVNNETRFMPMDIKLGAELEDDYVVEEGLSEGDTVVTSANFLIDSESKLKAAIGETGNAGGHKH